MSRYYNLVRVRHAQRRGRRREEELPVAVAAGRRRREHVRFVEEDSERPLATRDARRVHPQRSTEIVVGVSCGGAWLTRDDGASWEQIAHGMRADFLPEEQQFEPDSQDPHLIVRCPAQPDRLWTQHHCGIFRKDGDAAWEEITTAPVSAFGFAVAVHPQDPDRAWFVPAVKDQCRVPVDAKVVVQRTNDGGQSFEVQSDGLPQSHAYDLVFRHALAIDASGDRLAFGSTTGGLWLTQNGGDRWEQQALRLPPVYVVKWSS